MTAITKTDFFCLFIVLTACLLGVAAGSPPGSENSAASSAVSVPVMNRSDQAGEEGKLGKRLREGTTVTDQHGYFREDGEGATFAADSGMEFGALPNLNLERVLRLLKSAEEPTSIRWSVSGEVTEFNSRNFLLISRAVYKSAAPPPAPERVNE